MADDPNTPDQGDQTPQITLPDVYVGAQPPATAPVQQAGGGYTLAPSAPETTPAPSPEPTAPSEPAAPPPLSDSMIEARLNGHDWPAIDQHMAQFQNNAGQVGYTQAQVDDTVGRPTPLDQFPIAPYKDLVLNPKLPTMDVARPLAQDEYASGVDDTAFSTTINGVPSIVPHTWLLNGKPSVLDEDTASQLAETSKLEFPSFATGEEADTAAEQRNTQIQNGSPVPPLGTGDSAAPAPPTPKAAVDLPIGTIQASGLSPTLDNVKQTQQNMLAMALRAGSPMQQLYEDSHTQPLLQDALTTPNSVADRLTKQTVDAYHQAQAKAPTYPTLQDLHEKPLEHVYFGIPFLDLADENGGITKALKDAGIDAAELAGGAAAGHYIVAPALRAIAASPVGEAVKAAIGKAAEATGDLAQAAKDHFGAVLKDESGQLGKPLVGKVKPIPNPLLGVPAKDYLTSRGGYTELEDTLNRMEGKHDAELQSILKMQKAMPKEWADEKFQEDAYHYNETIGTSLFKPDPEFDAYNQFMKPLRDKEFQLANELVQLTRAPAYRQIRPGFTVFGKSNEPLPTLRQWDQGYVHRVLDEDMTNELVSQKETGNTLGPVTNTGHSLSEWASSAQARHDWFVHDAGNGNRMWGGDLSRFQGGLKYGDTYKDALTGQDVTISHPTTQEIEANTPYKYFKNHFINTAENVARLSQSVDNAKFINNELRQIEAAGQYVPAERVPAGNRGPAGMLPVNVDQIAGWAHPKIAHALNDYFSPDKVPDYLQRSRAITRFAMRWVFMNPLIHGGNISQLWATNRGLDWLTPAGYGAVSKFTAKAFDQVMNFGDDYLLHRAEGAAFQRSGMDTRNFLSVLHYRMGVEMVTDKNGLWAPIAKATGVDLPAMVKAVDDASHHTLWAWQDILALSRQYELMDKGMTLREAIYQSEKDIANYRLPSTVLGSRSLRQFLNEPGLDMFGRYHYAIARGIALQARDAIGPGMAMGDRLSALGKIIPQAAMAYGIWPLLGWGLSAAGRAMTGDPNLNIEANPRGNQVPLWALSEAAKSMAPQSVRNLAQRLPTWAQPNFPPITDAGYQWLRFVQTMVSFSPAVEVAAKLGGTLSSAEGLPQKIYKLAETAGGAVFPPFEWAQQAAKPHGFVRAIGQQLGFHIPTDPAVIAAAQKRDAAIVNSQDKHDPFVNWLSDLFSTPIPGGTGSSNDHYPVRESQPRHRR
jgi:hypothetical protein